MRLAFLTFAAFLLVHASAAAAPHVYRGSAGELHLSLPRVARGPVVDGALTDSVWAQAAVLDSFTQRDPREGVPDSLGTECLLLYDDFNLYVGFRCTDRTREVRSPITTRDQISGDWVGIAIDTYHDRRKSYLFISNPCGVQMDGVDQPGSDTDFSPDFLFRSKGRLNGHGYEVEMAIPFKSLRFPPRDTLTFGIEAARQIDRYNSQLFWAPITRDKTNFAEQFGTLTDITGIHPGRNFSVIPSLTGTRLGSRDGGDLTYESKTRAGATFTYGVTSGLTGNVAVTPDFSQVEADAGVIDVNQRFAIYFDEKRPFFLEGSEIFKMPINAVYTRRIADPLYGVKLAGKMSGTSVGVLQAADRSAGESVDSLPDRVNPYFRDDAHFTIGRFKQDVLKNSSVGLLMAERRQLETYNRDLGIDARFNLNERYNLSFQRLQSWSRDRDYRGAMRRLPSTEIAALGTDVPEHVGAITRGDATRGEISRDSKNLNIGAYGLDVSPDFAADMGFIQRTDQIDVGTWGTVHVFPKGASWFNSLNPNWTYNRIYEHRADRKPGKLTDENFNAEFELDLPRSSWLGLGSGSWFLSYNGRDFPAQHGSYLFAGCNRFQAVQVKGNISWGDAVIFDETVQGRSLGLTGHADLRFSPQLGAAVNLVSQRLRRRDNDTRFATLTIPRLTVTYQFTRELSLRWITELRSKRGYDTTGVLSSRSERLSLDLLASYQLHPGTVFYLGYGSILKGETGPALKASDNSAFVKISYLWEM